MFLRTLLLLALLLPLAGVAAAPTPPVIARQEVPTPSLAGAVGAALTLGPDGTAWVSWVDPGARGKNTLRAARFEAARSAWSSPRTIAADSSVTTNALDFPQLVVDGRGTMTALWTDGHGGARHSSSNDGGTTWSASAPWTRDGHEVEKFSLVRLADGRVLVAWLDGRGHHASHGAQQLYARVLGDSAGDRLIDDSVCDCCQTALTGFLDGGALVAYRGRTSDEIRDIRVARWRGGQWEPPHPLNNDGWRINACPVNGPRLASDGSRVGVAWYTGANDEPHVLASFSPDAGTRFLMPLQLDRGHPAGHVDVVLLRDGALLVTWTELDGSVWLRRITPDFDLTDPVALAPAGSVSPQCIPRVALLRDYEGGAASAQLLVTFARRQTNVAAVLVTVPEGAFVEAERNCTCAPDAAQLRGFPIRGTIVSLGRDGAAAQVEHAEVPGVLPAATQAFNVAPDARPALQPGRRFLGRIERRDNAWWLFDIRLLAAPAR